ncbi:MAG: hypothetical protein JW768_10540 [Chitinispirillaceae bacterium]|nr:hypothetical protein [Chitinispirillaceae bacterium]
MVSTSAILLIIVIAYHLWFSLRLLKAPLHPDTGQFLYRGFFKGKGHAFPLYRHPFGSLKRLLKDIFTPSGTDFHYSSSFYERIPKKEYLPLCQKIGSYLLAECVGRLLNNPKAFRICLSLYNAVSICLMYVLGSLIFSDAAGIAAAALFAAYLNMPYADSHQLHAEHLILLPMLCSLVLVILGCLFDLPLACVAAGVLVTAIVLLKSSSVFQCLFIVISPLFFFTSTQPVILVIVGVLVATALFFAYCAHKQLLAPYLLLAWSISSFTDYKKGIQFSVHKSVFNLARNAIADRLTMYVPFVGQMALVGTGVLFFILYFRSFPLSIVLFAATWLFFEMVTVLLQGKFYFSHLVSLFPVSTLMAGAAVAHAITRQEPAGALALGIALCITVTAVCSFWCSRDPLSYQLRLYTSLFHPHTLSFAAAEVIADYVKKHSDAGDRIKLWGYNSEFYVLAGRREHSGFNEDKIICDPVQLEGFWGAVWRRWMLRDMAADPPLYIADMYGTLNITIVEAVTGFRYEREMIFFSLYPLYRRMGAAEDRQPVTEDAVEQVAVSKELIEHAGKMVTRDEFITSVSRCFVRKDMSGADTMTGGGISDLLAAWRVLNGFQAPAGNA